MAASLVFRPQFGRPSEDARNSASNDTIESRAVGGQRTVGRFYVNRYATLLASDPSFETLPAFRRFAKIERYKIAPLASLALKASQLACFCLCV